MKNTGWNKIINQYRNDLILIFVLLFITVVVSCIYLVQHKNDPVSASVHYAGQQIGTLDLNENEEYIFLIDTNNARLTSVKEVNNNEKLQSYNKIQIKDHSISVIEADCYGQDCVRQKSISSKNEVIICLPHKLVLKIEEGSSGSEDAVTW